MVAKFIDEFHRNYFSKGQQCNNIYIERIGDIWFAESPARNALVGQCSAMAFIFQLNDNYLRHPYL